MTSRNEQNSGDEEGERRSADLVAGLVVAVVMIPQAMAYALLAGLPPQVGLYAGIVPVAIYGLLGTSPVVSTGPVALVSLLVAGTLGEVAEAGTPEYVVFAAALALGCGAVQLLLGLTRAGFFLNFLSSPVLKGFTSAAAVVIGLSEVKHLLGIEIPRTSRFTELVPALLARLPETDVPALLLGTTSIVLLLVFSRILPRLLRRGAWKESWIFTVERIGPLVVVILGIVTSWLLARTGLPRPAVVGPIPSGLPPVALPEVVDVPWRDIWPGALAITLVGFVQSFAVAKSLASRRRETVDANRELVAQGASNLGAALTGAYPVAGGVSRSILNDRAGARTGSSSYVTAITMGLTVLILTPLFRHLPQAALGAIIVVAVAGLVDVRSYLHTRRYSQAEGLAWLATFVAVLTHGLQVGIGVGVGTSLVLHIWRTSKPHMPIVGRKPGTEHFRAVERHEVNLCPHVVAMRIDESLYFANASQLETRLINAVAERPEVDAVLLICSSVNFIDTTALEALQRIALELRQEGAILYLAEVKGHVLERLERVGFLDYIGPDRIFLSAQLAWRALGCEEGEGLIGPGDEERSQDVVSQKDVEIRPRMK